MDKIAKAARIAEQIFFIFVSYLVLTRSKEEINHFLSRVLKAEIKDSILCLILFTVLIIIVEICWLKNAHLIKRNKRKSYQNYNDKHLFITAFVIVSFSQIISVFIEEAFFRGVILLIKDKFGTITALAAIPPMSFFWGFLHLDSKDNEKFLTKYHIIQIPLIGVFYSLIAICTDGIILSSLYHYISNEIIYSIVFFVKYKK